MASERRSKQTGPRTTGLAGGVAAAVRRRQRDRGPRVLFYDERGTSRAVWPSEPGFDELIAVAERIGEGLEEAANGDTLRDRVRDRRRQRDSE